MPSASRLARIDYTAAPGYGAAPAGTPRLNVKPMTKRRVEPKPATLPPDKIAAPKPRPTEYPPQRQPPTSLSDWKSEYRVLADHMRKFGYAGPDWAIWRDTAPMGILAINCRPQASGHAEHTAA